MTKIVDRVLSTAVQAQREGTKSAAEIAKNAVSDILKHGVTSSERAAVAAMVQNLKSTPHAGLAELIHQGVSQGASANTFQEIRERIVGGPAPSTTPSVSWREDVPTSAQQQDWNRAITDVQVALSVKNGHVGRGFHEKELFGGRTTLKVNQALPEEARIPPFWNAAENKPADLSGVVHFTNGQGCPFKDSAPDVRGLAVKLLDGDGKPWDILATNKQTFAQDTEQFIGFAKAGVPAQLADNFLVAEGKRGAVLAKEVGPIQAGRISAQLAKDTIFHKVNSLATESYDGGTFRTPDGHLAKIVLEPVPGKTPLMNRDQIEADENGLTSELYKQLENGPVKFRVQLKIFAGNGDEKDATDRWEPAKLINVGELTIPPPDKHNDEMIRKVVHGMRFNPGTGFAPAGQMAHARGAVKGGENPATGAHYEHKGIYETSADNRLALKDDAATLAVVKAIGSGNIDPSELKALADEVDRRKKQMQDEVRFGGVERRIGVERFNEATKDG